MMQIVYYTKKEQLIAAIQDQDSCKVFVTPSPAKADNLRNLLENQSNNDVVTISKFTSDLLERLWPVEDSRPIMKRKSELLLIFGILKNNYLPELGYEQFSQAYNLFSDLRSYTLNLEVLAPVLEEQSPDVAKAIQMFWSLLDAMKIVDEHGAYQAISEELRTHEEVDELKKTFIFWGFQHLNGQQVDLLKSLAIRYNVIIPFPLSLKDQLKRSDWLSWLIDHKVEEKILPEFEKNPIAQWLVVNSRELSRYLKEHCHPGTQVVLGLSALSSHHIDIIPSSDVNFKISHQLLLSEILEVAHDLSLSNTLDLTSWLKDEREKLLSLGKKISFKKLKVLQLYTDSLSSINELTDVVPPPDVFFKKLLKDVVLLNQPRTSYIPTLISEAQIELKDMSTLEDIDRSRPVIFCVDDRFDDFQSLGQTYTETIQKTLASLGPIKRNELDLQFKQWKMIDLFASASVLVLMSESVLKHSLVWKRVFNTIKLEKIISELKTFPRLPLDFFKDLPKTSFSGNLSASKFQNFYDCPRKFYYNYVEKISPTVTLQRDIDDKKSGTLVHRIIEIYFERRLSEENISEIAKEVLDEEILKSNLRIPQDIYSAELLKFSHRASNGISLLKKMEETTGQQIKWDIEYRFENKDKYHIKGSMDCVGISDTHIYLFDFKSTDSSASTNKDVVGLESLQLWVYILAANQNIAQFQNRSLVFGYVILDEPKKSNIFFIDSDLFQQVKEAKFCSPVEWKEDFKDSVQGARIKLETLAVSIAEEKVFPARPRSSDACTFCDISSVCTKNEVVDV